MVPAPLPSNESREHFLLKQVGLMWLKVRGSKWVATEIWGMGGRLAADEKPSSEAADYRRRAEGASEVWRDYFLAQGYRKIADVVGVARDRKGYTIRLIEVKVSRADFLSGYCTGAHLAYVMTPPGLVDPSELEDPVGLLEVDPAKVKPASEPRRIASLVRVVKLPKRQAKIEVDAVDVLGQIAARYASDAVYRNPWLISS